MLRFSILGDLEVRRDGRPVELPRAKQRALLGTLLLSDGRPVATERIADAVWGPAAPASARELIRLYVSQLRDLLGDDAIETRPGGYLVPEVLDLDAHAFRSRVAEARTARAEGNTSLARDAYQEALSLWRGEVLADSPLEGDGRIESQALEEERMVAIEEHFELQLEERAAAEVVAELERLVSLHPDRERLRGLLMLALYRSGRQPDALAAYRDARRRLSDEYGLEPGEDLRRLESAILRQDPALAARPQLPKQPRRRSRQIVVGASVAAAITAGTVLLSLPHHGRVLRPVPNSLAVLDGATGRQLGTVRLGAPPVTVAAGDRTVLAGTQSRTLAEIDPARLRVRRTVGLAEVPHAIAYAAGSVWVANGYDGTLTTVGLDGLVSPRERAEPHADGRLALAPAGRSIWVGSQDNIVTRLTGGVTSTAHGRAVQPEAAIVGFGSLWVAQATSVNLRRLDERTGRTMKLVPLGAPCSSLAVGISAVWALSATGDTLWRIDPALGAVTAAIPVHAATGVVADRRTVWVIDAPRGRLQAIDLHRNRVGATLDLGRPLGGATMLGGRLWLGIR